MARSCPASPPEHRDADGGRCGRRRVPADHHRGQDEYLDQSGFLDPEDFGLYQDGVTELAREIIGDVESSLGM
ncbi:hypothetical protein ACFYUM_35920 [Streptomyces fimicarius]|uniref:hypothetical protein n=1 Tax=Streptomyces griseus TaxID=1911 RepID=UPI00369975C8